MSIPKLLLRVRSKVIPEVFDHPIWINFANSNHIPSPELIQNLRNSARQYETQGDMLSSSEILFLCASLQKQLKNFEDAINSLQHARYLAENHDLPQSAIFASWGTAALYYQQGDIQLTIRSLTRLQKLVNMENDWILFDVIELIKQHLRNPVEDAGPLALALDWLNNWEKQIETRQTASRRFKNELVTHKSMYLSRVLQRLYKITKSVFRLPTKWTGELKISWEKGDPNEFDLPSQKMMTIRAGNKPELQASEVQYASGVYRHQEKPTHRKDAPALVVYCFGRFRVYQDEALIKEWPSGIGRSIFKYLITHRERPISKELLMDLFWKDADPESARNNLNVAIYGLRKALRNIRTEFSHILFQEDHYLLNPSMTIWVDVEKFSHHFEVGQGFEKAGETVRAMRDYEIAEGLYSGDFLEDDLYEDWTMPQRTRLKETYLFILDRLSSYYIDEKQYATCIHLCQKILVEDDCREDCHRRLMRCYFDQGQPYLALRQYHICMEILKKELDIPPTQNTKDLYDKIRRHNRG